MTLTKQTSIVLMMPWLLVAVGCGSPATLPVITGSVDAGNVVLDILRSSCLPRVATLHRSRLRRSSINA